MKKCPYCAEEIQDEAIVCRYCGRGLSEPVKLGTDVDADPPQPVATSTSQPSQTAKPPAKRQTGLLAGLAIVFVICCALLFARAVATSNPRVTPTAARVSEGANNVVISTHTRLATKTHEPTNTPKSTNTPRPTATSTPKPEPIVLSGTGDSVVDLQKWDGAAVAHITYAGGGNFVVWNYGADNEKIDLMVNTIGNYEGNRPIDFLDGQLTTRFEIEASGQWEIKIIPFADMRVIDIPGAAEGVGDDVVALVGDGKPDTLAVDNSQGNGNFAIWGYGNKKDLSVNEIAPYSGTVLVSSSLPTDNGVVVLEIVAEGNWSIDIKTK